MKQLYPQLSKAISMKFRTYKNNANKHPNNGDAAKGIL
jgi:hypothetical protein